MISEKQHLFINVSVLCSPTSNNNKFNNFYIENKFINKLFINRNFINIVFYIENKFINILEGDFKFIISDLNKLFCYLKAILLFNSDKMLYLYQFKGENFINKFQLHNI